MPKFSVAKSIPIAAPVERVYAVVSDFGTWTTWSPWLTLEPSARVDIAGTAGTAGHSYHWEGQRVGSGEMVMTSVSASEIDIALTFLKPYKSKAKVTFQLLADGAGTRATWTMDSALPFFLFFLVKMMKTMIGMDFTRGLRMLRDHIERGEIQSATEVLGVVDMPALRWAGLPASSSLDTIDTEMGAQFDALKARLADAGSPQTGPFASIYTKMDLGAARFDYIVAAQVADDASPAGLTTGEVAPGKAFKVRHTGRYDFIGNGWSLAMNHLRADKHKMLKKVPSLEVYVSDPDATPEAELITEIYIPVRG
jgi:predicted transcriptional regulator YdeE